MKLSTHQDDPGFKRNAQLYTVTLNGKNVRCCDLIYADDESGIVCTRKRNGNGDLVYRNGDTVTVIQRGKVIIAAPVRAPEEVPFA